MTEKCFENRRGYLYMGEYPESPNDVEISLSVTNHIFLKELLLSGLTIARDSRNHCRCICGTTAKYNPVTGYLYWHNCFTDEHAYVSETTDISLTSAMSKSRVNEILQDLAVDCPLFKQAINNGRHYLIPEIIDAQQNPNHWPVVYQRNRGPRKVATRQPVDDRHYGTRFGTLDEFPCDFETVIKQHESSWQLDADLWNAMVRGAEVKFTKSQITDFIQRGLMSPNHLPSWSKLVNNSPDNNALIPRESNTRAWQYFENTLCEMSGHIYDAQSVGQMIRGIAHLSMTSISENMVESRQINTWSKICQHAKQEGWWLDEHQRDTRQKYGVSEVSPWPFFCGQISQREGILSTSINVPHVPRQQRLLNALNNGRHYYSAFNVGAPHREPLTWIYWNKDESSLNLAELFEQYYIRCYTSFDQFSKDFNAAKSGPKKILHDELVRTQTHFIHTSAELYQRAEDIPYPQPSKSPNSFEGGDESPSGQDIFSESASDTVKQSAEDEWVLLDKKESPIEDNTSSSCVIS